MDYRWPLKQVLTVWAHLHEDFFFSVNIAAVFSFYRSLTNWLWWGEVYVWLEITICGIKRTRVWVLILETIQLPAPTDYPASCSIPTLTLFSSQLWICKVYHILKYVFNTIIIFPFSTSLKLKEPSILFMFFLPIVVVVVLLPSCVQFFATPPIQFSHSVMSNSLQTHRLGLPIFFPILKRQCNWILHLLSLSHHKFYNQFLTYFDVQ